MLLDPAEEPPAIFRDPAFAYSCHWFLSTSQISSEYYDGYGWGEVVPNGWGVAYMVKNNSLQFNLASSGQDCERFAHFFVEALNDMKKVFDSCVEVKAKL